MSNSDREFNNGSATEIGKKYVEKTISYYKLKLLKTLTENVSNMIKAIIISVFSIIMLLFLSISLAIYIGNKLENNVFGYLIVSAIYLIIVIIVYLSRKMIDKKVIQAISRIFK